MIARIGKRNVRELIKPFMDVPLHADGPEFYSDWHDVREFTIGDIGVGECAGEVVSLFGIEVVKAESQAFDAQVALDEGDYEEAEELAYRAMLSAARALVRTEYIDVTEDARRHRARSGARASSTPSASSTSTRAGAAGQYLLLRVPILQRQFPEIADFYLPPEGCSYRLAVISIRKGYPGHAKRVMFGLWSFLRQFMYTKFIVVTDDDIDIRDWKEVVWAITTRCDPVRDTTLVDHTPIDYLDFASPVAGLGGKMGLDATAKWPAETSRKWGDPIAHDAETQRRMAQLYDRLMAGRSSAPAA